MRIQTKLRINGWIAIGLGLVVVFAVLIAADRIHEATAKEDLADGILKSVAELESLTYYYVSHPEERPRQQWERKHEWLSALLVGGRTAGDGEGVLIERIRSNHQEAREIFAELVARLGAEETVNPEAKVLSEQSKERLVTQFIAKTQLMSDDAFRLSKASKQNIRGVLKTSISVVLASILLLVVSISAGSTLLGRSIVRSLRGLREGTEIVASGDLTRRIGMGSRDEIGELSASFDRMTDQLQAATVSKVELQKEVEERRRAEEELRLAYGRLQTFFDERIGGIGIVIANARGDILQANDYYLSILGYTREELLAGRVDWRRMTPPEWLPADERALAQLRECGVCETYEKEYARGDGSRVPVLITDAMMPGDSGDILAFVLDITHRKEAEGALQRARDAMALEVEERTKELRQKEVLLKEVHHRVKNNLQVISSLIALQTDRLNDPAVRDVLKELTHRVRSMALVHEKLYQSADLARVDFAEYARTLLNYLWRAHGDASSGVRLTLDVEPVPLSVNAAVPCGLILNELASNALKHAFHSRGEGQVTVLLRRSSEGEVSLIVRDDGAGLPRGFDWSSADTLGLSLVQMLAEQLHATIRTGSGDGTEFRVTFGGA